MANNQNLKNAIAQVVKENGNNEITGKIMQDALLSIINQFGVGSIFAGLANRSTNPGTPDQNLFYLAYEAGVYPNFGGYENSNNLVAFQNISGSWVATVLFELFTKDVYWGVPGYVSKFYGNIVDDQGGLYRSSFFMRIKDPAAIVITGYSGDSSSAALVSFYDVNRNFLKAYNAPGVNGQVSNHSVPSNDVPTSARYVRVTRLNSQNSALIQGVYIDGSMINSTGQDTAKLWTYVGNPRGFINKYTGELELNAEYTSSKYLYILSKSNLRVTGYSGADNAVSLVSFYDLNYKWIGSLNAPTGGAVSNYLVPEENIPAGAVFVRTSRQTNGSGNITGVDFDYETDIYDVNALVNKQLIGDINSQTAQGYINKANGFVSPSTGYLYSNLHIITDRANLVIKAGYSGASNAVALAAFYDIDMNFISAYNTTTAGTVYNVTVPEASIPTNAVYARFTLGIGQRIQFGITGASKVITTGTKEVDKMIGVQAESIASGKFIITSTQAFSEVGYVNKSNGIPWDTNLTPPSVYRHSLFLKITDKTNLRVTGYSGVSNQAALSYFYDAHFEPIKAVNAPTNGNVSNYLIPESEIPANAVYVRFTRTQGQGIVMSGVSLSYTVMDLIPYIDGKKPTDDDIIVVERSGKPNPDRGGHVKLINYLGNDQNIHPKVLYFPTAWNGFNWWMAYTPYPSGAVDAENPCIAASTDGKTWVTPTGLVNPLAFRLDEDNYNSDTHLVYRSDNNTLECWWREYRISTAQDAIVRSVSTDGVTWGAKEYIFNYGDHTGNMLSPAIIFEDGKYKVWYCSSGVVYRESSGDTPTGWSTPITLPIDFASQQLSAWHMDVIKTERGFEYAIQCPKTGFNNNTADLYYVLQTGTDMASASSYAKPELIVERGDQITDRDYLGIYRASIVWQPFTTAVPKNGGVYSIYYSAIGNNYNFRAIFLTKGRALSRLRGVNL